MLRRLLTYQLILAVAVGPLLCCCTAGQLLASPSASAGSPLLSDRPATRTADTRITCCAHKCQPAKSSQSRGDADHKPAPSKPGEKCPCKDGSGKSNAIPTKATSADVSTVLRAVTLDLVSPLAVTEGGACPNPHGQNAFTSRGTNASLSSTADLLFAHHNLRC